MPSRRGGRRWRPRALPGAGWDRHRWSSTTSRPWYFEADTGDGFREPGFSKERRLEPQITIGLRTDATGFPLMVNAFEGNKAESSTLVPTVQAFMAAHQLPDVTVVADAGMVSAGNQRAIEDAGLSFILGARIPDVPFVVKDWHKTHPDEQIPDGHIFTQPRPARTTSAATRSSTTKDRYRWRLRRLVTVGSACAMPEACVT